MAIRTTDALVIAVLQQDYGPLPTGGLPALTRYIKVANVITDRVVVCATGKGLSLSTDELKEIETWLAAHYYTKMDPTYTSKSTSGASGSFIRGKTEPEPYRQAAIEMDYTGCVNAILNRFFASLTWLGKAPSEQIPYHDRD